MAIRESEARRSEIARLARTSGLASVEDLSAQFGVTASTIRRDLSQLTAQGVIARTYGGAIALNLIRNPPCVNAQWRDSTPNGASPNGLLSRFGPGKPYFLMQVPP